MSELRDRIAEAMLRHYLDPSRSDVDRNGHCVCGGWSGGTMSEGWDDHLAEVAVAVRDDDLAAGLRRAEQAEAALARVREDLRDALAVWEREYDYYRVRAARSSADEAARAAYRVAIQAVGPILAALDVPADGEQTGGSDA